MGDNNYIGLFIVFVLLLLLIAVIKLGLAKSATRRRPTTWSDHDDNLSWDNWEPAHHGDHGGGSSHHSDSSHSDSSSSDSSSSDSSHGNSSSSDSSSSDSGSSGDSSSD